LAKQRFRIHFGKNIHNTACGPLPALVLQVISRQHHCMIDKLEMFIALAAERHFGRAALACGVTQPSLSSAIRQLEDQLGVQLVHRGSRFMGLTPEGARVLDWARRIVGDMRALKAEMRSVHSGLSGNLRIGVIPTALPMVAELTAPFIARHPNMRVTILSRTSAEILAGIDTLELGAGITYLDNEPLGRVAQVPLYTEFYRFLCSPDAPLSQKPAVTWAEVAAQPLCLLTADMQNRRIVNQHLADAGMAGQTGAMVESNSTIALISHIKTGAWASIVPKKLADMLGGTGMVSIPIIQPEAEHLVGLITAKIDPQTPVLQALIDAAAKFKD
jgi:DNA-binding transcriptional LysR family regulator